MKLKITLTATAVVALGIGAPPALAVRALPTYTATTLDSPEPEAGALFGNFMSAVGDLDKDGANEVAVSSERQSSGTDTQVGRVYVFSGRTREVLRTIQNPDPQPGNGFGDSIIGIGDANGDGVPDLVISGSGTSVYVGRSDTGAANTKPCGATEPNGCNENQGRVYVFSGRTGSLIRRVEAPTPQSGIYFGYGFGTATNDLNNDGVGDFVETDSQTIGVCDADGEPTTPPTEPCPFVGAAYAFSGKTGALLYRFRNPGDAAPEPYASFGGGGSSNPGDVTGDGIDDIVMGASGASPRGRAWLFNGKDGSVVRELFDPDSPNNEGAGWPYGEGQGVEPGDVNGDGIRDLIVAAPGQDVRGVNNAGRLYLLSGKDGSLIRTLDDPAPKASGSFGFSHASAGDLNDDGTPDVLGSRFIFPVNVYLMDSPPIPAPGGAAYVFDGRNGAPLVTLPGMTRDGPGSSVASPGDVNGDGYPDYFLGGRLLNVGAGENSGRVVVELSKAPPAVAPPGVVPPGVVPPGVTPPAVKPPVVGAKAPRVSVAGFTARVSPARDRRAPYRFTVSGEVRRPAKIAASACKGGRVSVQTKVGTKTISTRRVMLKSNCSYRVAVTFAIRSRLGRGRLTLRVRFLGNARFKPAGPRTLSARAG